ncbi:MAG: alpha/beta fold hydrolase [Caulobacteraceae bacterium]
MRILFAALAIGLLAMTPALAQPKGGTWTIRDFRFHTGETLPELKQHYVTLGSPANPAVLVLHGTGGTGEGMLNPAFGGELFGPGQPLDSSRYFIVIPDTIGAGGSSKPSDGLRMRFPAYDYADMVEAQHRLLTEHLGIKHLKLVTGNSMGGMLTWLWGEAYPDFMDALVPLASQPTQVAGRNWIARRMVIDLIKADPAWKGGDYTSQPPAYTTAMTYFGLMTSGGAQAQYEALSTLAAADRAVAQSLARPAGGDANDIIYQFNAARNYDPGPKLETIKAHVLAINSADDERNPPELGVVQREMKRLKNGRLYLIPASNQTRGHGTTGAAKWWAHLLPAFLAGG